MRIVLSVFFFFLLLQLDNNLFSQPAGDTLELVRQLRDNDEMKAAMKLLESYHATHPKDLNSSWLYAQTAYLTKQNKLARQVYELAIWYHPENLYLQMDYAEMLVNIGKFEKAMPYLENFLVYYPDNTQVQLTLAKVTFWKGRYKEADNAVSGILKADPNNREACSLLDEILLAKAPWLGLNALYHNDDQPLQSITPVIESDIWLHPLSTLRFRLRTPFFSQGGTYTNALWVQAGNSMFIWKGNWKVITDVGFLKYPYKNTTTWTANFVAGKRSYRHLVTSFQAERKPYFSTGSSIDTVVNEYHVAEIISWDNLNSWNGTISYNWDYFLTDYNSIYAIAVWGFTPPVRASVFDFRFGYGFSYTNAVKDRFVPVGSEADIIANFDPSVGIKGIYYPYFTPKDQSIHSAIASIGIHPLKGFDIGISGNLGFYATAQIPYFYLDTNNAGGYSIIKDFSREKYFPFNISTYVALQLSKKISLRVDYAYNSTYFYIDHYVGLRLKIHFWNAKRRK